eukprot:scaffold2393_cov267-Pinguiococcus_pyrenoidosus.AAC.9
MLVASVRALRRPLRRSTLAMKTEAKSQYNIVLLPGDGIGPEITKVTVSVLEAVGEKTGVSFDFSYGDIGGIALDNHDNPFPDETLEKCRNADSVLLACIGGYKWDNNPRDKRPETGLLKMREALGLFANLRPAKVIPALIGASTLKPEVVDGVDIMVVRELTGDVYFGKPKGIEMRDGDAIFYRRREDPIANAVLGTLVQESVWDSTT